MLKLTKISKTYQIGDFSQNALDQVDLEFRKSEFVSVLGPSGGGKTTLLNVIGGLDRATQGDLIINGKSTKSFTDREWDMYRNNSIGFIFQSHNLITHLSVLQNVEMGLSLSGSDMKSKKARAIELLNRVGLKDHVHKKPNQLSGGQSQRVAIARALANNPDIILADEPTGSLDTDTGKQILDLIKEIAKDKLVIMVTHDAEMAYEYANRVIKIKDGQITDDSNPIKHDLDENDKLSLKKTSMSFVTAFISSINNIQTKLGRTILTAFAGSIGIIGIALILSLSNGMQGEIDKFEREASSSYPIQIRDVSLDINNLMAYRGEQGELTEHPDYDYIIPEVSSFEQFGILNPVNDNYIEYIQRYIRNEGQETLAGYAFNYRFNTTLLYENIDGDYEIVESENQIPEEEDFLPFSMSFLKIQPEGDVFDDNYELISASGRLPNNTVQQMDNKEIEVLLAIDAYNQISKNQLDYLGFDTSDMTEEDTISFTEIIGRKLKLYFGDYVEGTSNVSDAYTLTITGIIRTKPDTNVNLYMGGGLVYSSNVEAYFLSNHSDDLGTNLLNRSGIQQISLYPIDFESKEIILDYLDDYNRLYPDNEVIYNDQAALFTTISNGIIEAISIVLIAFASISLVVSSIMIAIITYVSVLERTKEIGVLRALGARKKDISRVFNTENIIIGFSAGSVGIIITLLLMIPLNIILENLSDIPNIAKLSFLHIVALIAISVFLAFLAGLIPARMAARKDPVEALRTE